MASQTLLITKLAAIEYFGLAVGFTCCLLISGFLYNELSYDTFPKDAKDITG